MIIGGATWDTYTHYYIIKHACNSYSRWCGLHERWADQARIGARAAAADAAEHTVGALSEAVGILIITAYEYWTVCRCDDDRYVYGGWSLELGASWRQFGVLDPPNETIKY